MQHLSSENVFNISRICFTKIFDRYYTLLVVIWQMNSNYVSFRFFITNKTRKNLLLALCHAPFHIALLAYTFLFEGLCTIQSTYSDVLTNCGWNKFIFLMFAVRVWAVFARCRRLNLEMHITACECLWNFTVWFYLVTFVLWNLINSLLSFRCLFIMYLTHCFIFFFLESRFWVRNENFISWFIIHFVHMSISCYENLFIKKSKFDWINSDKLKVHRFKIIYLILL